jgi:hypothetical protein
MYNTRHSRPVFNFLDRFSKTNQISRSIKMLPVGGWLFHAKGRMDGDRQTDRNYETVVFRNLANAPNTSKLISVVQVVNIGGELKFYRIVKGYNFRITGVKSSDAAATQLCRFPPFVIRKCMLYYYQPKNMKTHNFMDESNLTLCPIIL